MNEISLATNFVDDPKVMYALDRRERLEALLIDDDPSDAIIIQRLAARSRHLDIRLRVSFSFEEANRLLASRSFDVVYIDYWMGCETSVRFVCDLAASHPLPRILLTGLDEPEVRRVAFRAGVNGFLSKDELSTQAIEAVTLAVVRAAALSDPSRAAGLR